VKRWAVRFGYDGRGYRGWARQPGQRTVEGTILRGLVRCGAVPTEAAARLVVASRTDRGVSARRNVLALSSEVPGDALLRALNGVAPDLFFTSAVPVEETFSPRRALWRRYRYFEPAQGRQLSNWKAAAGLFEGPVDVRTFGRGFSAGAPSIRSVDFVRVRRDQDVLVVDAQAPRFVWGMVRKMVAGIREFDGGHLSLDRLRSAIRGNIRLTLPLAEPERLVLWEVRTAVKWKYRREGWTRSQQRYVRLRREELATSRALLAALQESSPQT